MEAERSPESVNDLIKFALIALLIVIPIRLFVAQPFIVRGASMEPTFDNGEYLIVDQLSYRFETPERGEVVIFRYPKNPTVFFIKRVIGLPGETVEITGKRITIRRGVGVEPIVLDQSFIDPERMSSEYGVYALGDDEYFVMGDNRLESSDSRTWGPLPKEDLIGRAIVRLFPPTRFGIYPGEVSLTH
ncbi:MAG: signal peptidase I [Patescibacteria group bacterium]